MKKKPGKKIQQPIFGRYQHQIPKIRQDKVILEMKTSAEHTLHANTGNTDTL